MALAFRNIDASPADPVQTWPFEGVLTALERGGLDEWRRLAQAIKADPWGQVARYVEQVVAVAHPYGVSEVMTDIVAEARRDAEASERAEVAATVRSLITASGRTQARFAADLGTSASRLSTYASGSVVPSSAMLVRMRRTVELGRQN
jgi:DNA-binding transcriptional regulator YiaG